MGHTNYAVVLTTHGLALSVLLAPKCTETLLIDWVHVWYGICLNTRYILRHIVTWYWYPCNTWSPWIADSAHWRMWNSTKWASYWANLLKNAANFGAWAISSHMFELATSKLRFLNNYIYVKLSLISIVYVVITPPLSCILPKIICVYFARIVLEGESFSQILINLDALAFYGKDPKHPPLWTLCGVMLWVCWDFLCNWRTQL
jgi:hypothetical protein